MIYKVLTNNEPKEVILTINASTLEEAYLQALVIKRLDSENFDRLFTIQKAELLETPSNVNKHLLLG
jgi:hypothetical protein